MLPPGAGVYRRVRQPANSIPAPAWAEIPPMVARPAIVAHLAMDALTARLSPLYDAGAVAGV